MNCLTRTKDGAEVLVDYCSGALDTARAAELERHIETCAECLRMVEAQREVWSALEGFGAPAVSADFNARLYARIAQEQSEPAWRKWARRIFQPALPVPMWKPAVSLAAAAAVLAIALAVRTPEPVQAPKQVRAEMVDIEQVANTLDDLEILTPSSVM